MKFYQVECKTAYLMFLENYERHYFAHEEEIPFYFPMQFFNIETGHFDIRSYEEFRKLNKKEKITF